jgi:PAS domain S-box-containing protein
VWRNLPIKHKLALVTLATTSAALLVASAALFTFELVNFRQTVARDLTAAAEIVAANCSAPISFAQVDEAEEALVALQAKPHVLAAAIYLPNNSLFAGYSPPGVVPHFPPAPLADGSSLRAGRLTLFHPVRHGPTRLGTIYLEYDYNAKLGELVKLYAGIVLMVVVTSLLLALFLSSRLQQVISGPILALVSTAKAISERQDYSLRARKFGQDELAPFIDSFNQMLGRIQEQDGALRRAKDQLEDRVEERTRELRELQRQLELILNSAGEGIYGLDLQGRVTFANAAAAKALGWQSQEMIGQVEHDLMRHGGTDGQPYPAANCPVCAGRWDGKAHHLTEPMFGRKDGSPFPVELVSTPIQEGGKVIGVVVVFKDTTERRTLEHQLRQAQKMESIGRLAAGISHDFNNILMVIRGHATLLAQGGAAPQDSADAVKQIQDAAERATNLTQQLLAFSRKQVLRRKVLDLNTVVGNIARMLTRLLGEDVELRMELAPGLPPVQGDTGMLEQVLINLAVNARDAMPRGGRLLVATRLQTVDQAYAQRNPEARPGRYVCLSATDTGCGMDAQTLSRIFEPFFTTKEVGKGTGLGLATVYGVVKQHHGWIEVSSRLGHGSCFTVFLPATEAKLETAAAPAEGPAESLDGHGTVLVVEDEHALRALTRRYLQARGYQVLEAGSGVEALEVWARSPAPVDLLFTDMVLPQGISGGELAKRLKARKPSLKVLYTSGYSIELTGRDLDLRPGINFLAKPYTEETLAKAVRFCMRTQN